MLRYHARTLTTRDAWMKNLGTILLGIWLILTGLRGVISLSFQYDHLVLGGLATAAGVLLIFRR